MKKIIITYVCLFCFFNLFAQHKLAPLEEWTSIEITEGNNCPSIKLFKEGLICHNIATINGVYTHSIMFFPLLTLDAKKLNLLQNFLLSDSIFYKDSLYTDTLFQPVGFAPWIQIFIIHPNYTSNSIVWEKSKNEKLIKCVELLNDLVPDNYKDVYFIQPYYFKKKKW